MAVVSRINSNQVDARIQFVVDPVARSPYHSIGKRKRRHFCRLYSFTTYGINAVSWANTLQRRTERGPNWAVVVGVAVTRAT